VELLVICPQVGLRDRIDLGRLERELGRTVTFRDLLDYLRDKSPSVQALGNNVDFQYIGANGEIATVSRTDAVTHAEAHETLYLQPSSATPVSPPIVPGTTPHDRGDIHRPVPPIRGSRAGHLKPLIPIVALVVVLWVVFSLVTSHNRAPTSAPSGSAGLGLLSSKTWFSDGSNCFFASDGYHVKGDAGTCTSSIKVTDADIVVTARSLVGGRAGIAFRGDYLYQLSGTGDWSVSGSADLVRATFSPVILLGAEAVNQLRVRMQGPVLTFFVNGVQLGQVTDSKYSAGSVGVMGYGASNEVVYTDLGVVRL